MRSACPVTETRSPGWQPSPPARGRGPDPGIRPSPASACLPACHMQHAAECEYRRCSARENGRILALFLAVWHCLRHQRSAVKVALRAPWPGSQANVQPTHGQPRSPLSLSLPLPKPRYKRIPHCCIFTESSEKTFWRSKKSQSKPSSLPACLSRIGRSIHATSCQGLRW